MENAGYLFAAFTIIWALVFGYVFSLSRRQRQLRREIDSLKETLKRQESPES
ncbi:MAG: CcmD family protein [Dehalococcoidales bacterium]